MEHHLEAVETLILSILVLYVGAVLTRRIGFLSRNSIPPAVTGGLLCSILVAFIFGVWELKITFDTALRDLLLLVFFSTIGLTARLRLLVAGGKALVLLLVIAVGFLVLQNSTGVLLALGFDAHPAMGLFAGSISFAGGHGTAIAWGNEAAKAGFAVAGDVGIAFATFGLIAGGVIGGPIAERLIRRHRLQASSDEGSAKSAAAEARAGGQVSVDDVLGTIFLLALCVGLGDQVNKLLFAEGVLLPGFLTAMVVGIVLTNLADARGWQVNDMVIDLFGDVSLRIFLAISLMSMDLLILAQAMGPMLIVLFVQVTLMTFIAVFIVFRVMGRDYDAAIISSGFAGLGLGATPVAIGNMQAVTSKHGPSPKAFLVVPLVGAFFIDIANALVIKFFLGLPMFQV